MQIAIVDDDVVQLDWLQAALPHAGYRCSTFTSAQAAIEGLGRKTFDLLLLDGEMPDMDSIELMQRLRSTMATPPPIIFIAECGDECGVAPALSAGAEDFVSKPIRMNELLARISAILRKSAPRADRLRSFQPYTLDEQLQQVSFRGRTIQLTTREFELVLLLFQNSDQLMTRQHLLQRFWQMTPQPDGTTWVSRSLDTHISRIRTRLELQAQNGWRLRSIYGQGYRLERTVD